MRERAVRRARRAQAYLNSTLSTASKRTSPGARIVCPPHGESPRCTATPVDRFGVQPHRQPFDFQALRRESPRHRRALCSTPRTTPWCCRSMSASTELSPCCRCASENSCYRRHGTPRWSPPAKSSHAVNRDTVIRSSVQIAQCDAGTSMSISTSITTPLTNTPTVRAWLARRPRYHLHFTPTYASVASRTLVRPHYPEGHSPWFLLQCQGSGPIVRRTLQRQYQPFRGLLRPNPSSLKSNDFAHIFLGRNTSSPW